MFMSFETSKFNVTFKQEICKEQFYNETSKNTSKIRLFVD